MTIQKSSRNSTICNQRKLLQFQQQRARMHNWLESQHGNIKDKDKDERLRLRELGA